ncbi:MAG: hypothetical protein ACXAB7_00195 [Candidatus Kariarchaeaceae archaeon]|jgi:cytochrome c oxidase subunit 2
MTFLQQVKYTILGFLGVGVLGLLYLIGTNYDGGEDMTKFDFTEDKLNVSRTLLLLWEFVWLTVIVIGAIYLARRVTNPENKNAEERLEAFEGTLFKIVISALVLAGILTLLVPAFVGDGLPQYRTDDSGEVIDVQAQQYAFTILKDGAPVSATNPLETGTTYVFELRTIDTTHGFGIYDPDGILLVQAQIVPDYTTRLVYNFDDAGTYKIICMEYCGIDHHGMLYDQLVVV